MKDHDTFRCAALTIVRGRATRDFTYAGKDCLGPRFGSTFRNLLSSASTSDANF